MAALAFFGVVSIWAYSPGEGTRQLLFLLAAFLVMLALQRFPYASLGRIAWGLYLASLLPVAYTVLDRVVHVPLVWARNDARNWIDLGLFSFQPSELVKIAVVLLLARMLRNGPLGKGLLSLTKPFAAVFAAMGLILLQPDLGTALTLLPPLGVMLFAAGQRLRDLLTVLLLALVVSPLLWFAGQQQVPLLRHLPVMVKEYQRGRVEALFSDDPSYLKTWGYQQQRALEALGSGGALGKGWGQIPIGQRIPEAETDMILALIGEQFGLVGVAATLLAYSILYSGGLSIAAATRDPTGRLIAVGLTTLLAAQTALNMGVALRLMPVTGVTLPLVSYGGSSLLATFIAIGLLINVAAARASSSR